MRVMLMMLLYSVQFALLGAFWCSAQITAVAMATTTTRSQAITTSPKDTNVIHGESATLYCTISNMESGSVPFWTKNGELFAGRPADARWAQTNDDAVKRWAIFGDESEGEFNLQIINVVESDAGLYACNVTMLMTPGAITDSTSNAMTGYLASAPAALHVLPPPDGELPECLISIEGALDVGEAVEFTCAYKTNRSDVELRWTKRDDASFSPTSPMTHFRDGFVVQQFYHSIDRNDHLSEFQCIADSSDLPSPRSCTTGFILVRHAPSVAMSPVAPAAVAGGSVNVTCLIESSYPHDFTYVWHYKGRRAENYSGKIVLQGTTATIVNLEKEDVDATLSCEAFNAVGSNRASVIIEVIDANTSSKNIAWITPTAIVILFILLIVIISAIILGGRCCIGNYARRKKLKANGWTAERFVVDAHLVPMPERRGSDATSDFYMTRAIKTPGSDDNRNQWQQNGHAGTNYVQETAFDDANVSSSGSSDYSSYQIQPDSQQHRGYGSIAENTHAQREQRTLNERDRMRQNKLPANPPSQVNKTSPANGQVSPGFSDSGLDHQSSFEGSPRTPAQETSSLYANVRRGRMPRMGSRLSVQERQAIMDSL